MLTLKLIDSRTDRTRIVECASAEVVVEGVNKRVIAINDERRDEFVVGKEQEFQVAYVENSRGSTTQVVRGA